MIIIRRNDGHSLNVSAAEAFADHPKGLIVEMPNDNFYITSVRSILDLQELARDRAVPGSEIVIIRGHFESWPQTNR